jgi:hypothetical protein
MYNMTKNLRFNIFVGMKIQIMVFWVLTPHSGVVGYHHVTTRYQKPEVHDLINEKYLK